MGDLHVLRRRSPNPNSPIPYSPALLSPYLNVGLNEPSSHRTAHAPSRGTSYLSRWGDDSNHLQPLPTIRLVTSGGSTGSTGADGSSNHSWVGSDSTGMWDAREGEYDYDPKYKSTQRHTYDDGREDRHGSSALGAGGYSYAPRTSRSRSDDRYLHRDASPLTPSLQRHGTDPPCLPSRGGWGWVDRLPFARVLGGTALGPTLPLFVRKASDSIASARPITGSRGDSGFRGDSGSRGDSDFRDDSGGGIDYRRDRARAGSAGGTEDDGVGGSGDSTTVESTPLSTPGKGSSVSSVTGTMRSFRRPFYRPPSTALATVPDSALASRPSPDRYGPQLHTCSDSRHSRANAASHSHSPQPLCYRPASPACSVRSGKSVNSAGSSGSSTSTLPVPYYPSTPGFQSSGAPGTIPATGDGCALDEKGQGIRLERLESTGLAVKVTDKFPVGGRLRKEGRRDKWTVEKGLLVFSIVSVFSYGLAGLVWGMLILLRISENTDVTMVTDPDIVIFLILASLLCIASSLIGVTGAVLNSRPILAFYNLLLWPTLLSMCLVGYTSYKRGNLQLDRKLNQTWSEFLTDEQRLRVQNSLRCCGYYNPLHDATYSTKCYPRTILPGCKGKWYRFEVARLHDFATAAFSTIPFHLLNIVVALLCSNHVNRTFGKGLTPPHYRLKISDVRANAVAALASLPSIGSRTSLKRQPATSFRRTDRDKPLPIVPAGSMRILSAESSSIRDSRSSRGSLGSRGRRDSRDSLDTLTEKYQMRSRERGWKDTLRQPGPRARALREARERGLL